MYVPGRLVWCTSSKHHALAFGPIFTVDSDKILWKRKSTFDGLYNETVSLFYNCKDLVYYGGQFKCHSNRQKNPDGDRVQEDTVRVFFTIGWDKNSKFHFRSQSMFEMADATISTTTQKNHHVLRKLVVQLWAYSALGLTTTSITHLLNGSITITRP